MPGAQRKMSRDTGRSTMNLDSTDGARCLLNLLKRELDAVTARLNAETAVPKAASPTGDFLDIAQGVQHQELARLNAERLSERARRLRDALSRVSDGEYGICAECGEAIPAKRLVAVPDATTCLACQERLERTRLADCR
jgi:DnaK suppressor protein